MRYEGDPYSLSAWTASDEVSFARAVTMAHKNNIVGTSGDDELKGTSANDRFQLQLGGDDTVYGRGGNDSFVFEGSLTSEDYVDGGSGRDTVAFGGREMSMLRIENLVSVEVIKIQGGANVFLDDGFSDLKITAKLAGRTLINGSGLTTGELKLYGGGSDDTLIGGSRGDRLEGGGLGDTLTGGEGRDLFFYRSKYDSRPQSPDLITDFNKGDTVRLFLDETVSSYHLGATLDHVGDILFSYDHGSDMTILKIFTDGDNQADMQVNLLGEFNILSVINSSDLLIG